jgi:hypothetical protein
MEDTKTTADNTEPPAKLKPWQETALCEDIEATNGPVSDFNFIQLANRTTRVYGFPGTVLRELFRLRVKYLKKLPLDKYIRWLKIVKVAASAYSQNKLLDNTTEAFGNASLSINPPSPAPPSPNQSPAEPPPAVVTSIGRR